MKKLFYLLFGTLMFTSCVDDVNPSNNVEFIQTQYANAFTNTFGEVASNQSWGFSSGSMRSAYPNSNMWEDEGYVIPADITEDEIEKVLAVFNQKGEEHYESLVDWDCFFVQQVWKGTASYTAGNGGTVVGGNQMDWLCAYDPIGHEETIYPDWNNWQATVITNHDDHVNNFNNAAGSIMLMINSSTQRFGYKSSTDNGHVFYYFRMEYIDGAYYVGFDFSAEGQNPNEQVQRDYIYNDWIVKIVPGKGTPNWKFLCRVFAEDLSATSSTDFDFNDVVFDVYTDGTDAKVQLLAAGGTLELTVAGHEVHDAFGVSTTTMVNTGLNDGLEAEPFIVEGVSTLEQVRDNIHIVVTKLGTLCELHANQGEPAAKFAIPAQVAWADERQSIKDKYSKFGQWINDPTVKWWE